MRTELVLMAWKKVRGMLLSSSRRSEAMSQQRLMVMVGVSAWTMSILAFCVVKMMFAAVVPAPSEPQGLWRNSRGGGAGPYQRSYTGPFPAHS